MEKPMIEKLKTLIAQMGVILHEAHEIVNASLAEEAADVAAADGKIESGELTKGLGE